MRKATVFLKISSLIFFLLVLNTQSLFCMTRMYFERDDSLAVKLLVMIIGMALVVLVAAKVIYPQLLEEGMNPFKARNVFNVTIYSFFVVLWGITFHATLDMLSVSIVLGAIMVIWMLVAIIKD